MDVEAIHDRNINHIMLNIEGLSPENEEAIFVSFTSSTC